MILESLVADLPTLIVLDKLQVNQRANWGFKKSMDRFYVKMLFLYKGKKM